MTKDEALRLAWDALEDIGDEWGFTSERTVPKRKEAITAIKKALANEALEKMAENARELGLDYEPPQKPYCYTYTENGEEYFAPPTAYVPDNATPLYTTPPQRTWVGLTDEDFLEACQIAERGNYLVAFQRIQAKLKEKNT